MLQKLRVQMLVQKIYQLRLIALVTLLSKPNKGVKKLFVLLLVFQVQGRHWLGSILLISV